MPAEKRVIVIGAGVVGLTTAIKIQEEGGYKVTIIAEFLPSDPKCIKYTSHWAGAHHVSTGDNAQQLNLEKETFQTMWELSAPGGAAEGCLLRINQTEHYTDQIAKPHMLEFMPDCKYLREPALAPGCVSGLSFTTVNIDTPVYLNYLLARFLARGGSVVRGAVQHINEVIEGGPRIFDKARNISSPVDAVIVCTGLGARSLGGVEDKAMYPLRGQTVLLRAPWVNFGRSNDWTYIIPRRSGDVIVGGTRTPDDWYPSVRPETTLDILERCLALCPELAPPEVRAKREPVVDDLFPIIIEECCGLRPARKGGIRLELDWANAMQRNGKVPIVYNYGHGGVGFQTSWGSASRALKLLEEGLANQAGI